ncbi:hypothetical protein [Actinomadura atramentaria]|uniref:hypothetical protein n=1 Tax=Actinomadura atramentaria TaxID=1990 RepID=UPI000374AB1F|nr:hypothetical protein [Actinomadura atramentaria]
MTITEFRRSFPGVPCWWGTFTREWWALVRTPRRDRLVHASSVDGLARAVVRELRR